MTKTLNVQLDDEISQRAESILNLYGLDISTFLRMTLCATVNQGRIPYDISYNPKFRAVESLTKEEIEANSTEKGDWLFDEEEGRFIRPEIVAELVEERENPTKRFAPNADETFEEFLERISIEDGDDE